MPILHSNRVLTESGVLPAWIEIQGATITAVHSTPPAGEFLHYGDRVIMAGLVDAHVHVNEPGRTEWEGFATATRAAAAGGITTIVDMPLNSIPPTTTAAAMRTKTQSLQGHCSVDVALWGGVVPGNATELAPMIEMGAAGFKCFLIDSGVPEFPPVGEKELREAARLLARGGRPLIVHAELPGPIVAAEAAIAGADPRDYRTYLHSRPASAEHEAIALMAKVCRETGARMHVVHLSASSALEILRTARQEGLPLSAETTPHYLHFAAEEIESGRLEFKCAPPIRERANREALWQALGEGLIRCVVSDHSPCTPELKRGDFMKAWGGISSLQFLLPIVWTGAQQRGFDLPDLARWLCSGPAELAGLRAKGRIAPGNDADLTIWSPEETLTVREEIIEHRHKVTPYAGAELRGVVEEVWLRGERIDRLQPRGHWLRPK